MHTTHLLHLSRWLFISLAIVRLQWCCADLLHLQVPSIIADFSNLRMLGHVYVVEDAKDLAQIVRDVTRYGGAYRPEVCELWCPLSISLFGFKIS